MSVIENGKAVLFDFDGTLWDTIPAWLIAIEYGLKQIKDKGVPLSKPLPSTRKELLSVLAPELNNISHYGVDDKTTAEFVDGVVNHAFSYLPTTTCNEGVIEMLEMLADRQIKMAVVSTSESSFISHKLAEIGVDGAFLAIVGREQVRQVKPDPEAIYLALKALESHPNDAYMVGDNPIDIQAARAAGIRSVLYYPGMHQELYAYDPDYLASLRPDFVITSFSELGKILE